MDDANRCSKDTKVERKFRFLTPYPPLTEHAQLGSPRAFSGPKVPSKLGQNLLSDKAPVWLSVYITAARRFTDCRPRELAEVSGSAPLSRALDAQPAKHEYTSYADGPISPSHSMHSLYGPVKRSAMSDVVGPLCW